MLNLQTDLSTMPYVEECFGVWCMYEPAFNALRQHAESINIQLHMENATPQRAAARVDSRRAESNGNVGNVAVIPVVGSIMKHVSSFSSGTSTVETRRAIRAAVNDQSIDAIMMYVDSPGGTVKGIHDLADELNLARKQKPLWAFVEDLGASAGYWIASQSDRLVANQSAVLGSIGVFSVVYDVSRMAENDGVKVHVIKAGEFKGAAVPGTVVTDQQLAEFKRLTDSYYSDFIKAVSDGRKISYDAASALADGRVHKGQATVDMKLADALMTFDEALSELASVGRSSSSATRKGSVMSQETTADNVATAEPKPATIGELRKACVGADDSFILGQLEDRATITEAMAAFIAHQAEQNATLAKARDDAEKNASKQASEAARTRPGAKALSEGGSAENESSGGITVEQIRLDVAKLKADRGILMAEAFHIYFKDNPDAHAVWMQALPPTRTRPTK